MSKHPSGPDRVIVTLPLRLVNSANTREHWGKRAKRTKGERVAVWVMLRHESICESTHYGVTITRIAPRAFDSDGMAISAKGVRDEVAAWLGMDDAPDSGIAWEYAQRKGEPKQYAVEIEVEAL